MDKFSRNDKEFFQYIKYRRVGFGNKVISNLGSLSLNNLEKGVLKKCSLKFNFLFIFLLQVQFLFDLLCKIYLNNFLISILKPIFRLPKNI